MAGGIVPQRRISKTRKRQRRSHFKLDMPGMMVCPNCGEMKLAHIVCKECGFYDGKLVKEIKTNEEAEKEVVQETTKKPKKTEKASKVEKVEEKPAKAKKVEKPQEKQQKTTTKKLAKVVEKE